MDEPQQRIAVIGAGVAGITTAHLLQRNAHVKLFEKNKRLGGHTNTVVLEDCPDAGVGIDTGFAVFNGNASPSLLRLLEDLNCPVRFADTSFSISTEDSPAYYTNKKFSGFISHLRNMLKPSTRKLITEINRLKKQAKREPHWGIYKCLISNPSQTIVGGSHAYIKAFRRTFCGQIALDAKIKTVRRNDDGVTIVHDDGYEENFDKVIFAAHADQSLRLLESPTHDEQNLLGTWKYQNTRVILHRDASFLPHNRKAWAACNYIERTIQRRPSGPVTCHMNRIQNLSLHDEYFVTLNPDREPLAGTLVEDCVYQLPVFSPEAIASQAKLPDLNGKKHTWFCGSYFGNGFHEDAVRSGMQVAKDFGESF